MKFLGGSNWISITNNATKFIIEKEALIKKIFKHSFCTDELFIHTLLYNSSFKQKIYLLKISDINNDSDCNMYEANKRYIDWIRDKPYTFNKNDFNDLIDSPYLFARKFSTYETMSYSLFY